MARFPVQSTPQKAIRNEHVPPDRPRKRSAPQWDEPQERRILNSFSHSFGREPSPTPSVSRRLAFRSKHAAPRRPRHRRHSVPPSAEESRETPENHDGDDTSRVLPPDVKQDVRREPAADKEISTAALIFNKHESTHPYYLTAVKQMVELIFSDDHFDAGLSLRATQLAKKLLGFGLDKAELVTADLLDFARHSKATRLGKSLTDDATLHTFLRDVMSGVSVPIVHDVLRKWQRDLEVRMKEEASKAAEGGGASQRQLVSPPSSHRSAEDKADRGPASPFPVPGPFQAHGGRDISVPDRDVHAEDVHHATVMDDGEDNNDLDPGDDEAETDAMEDAESQADATHDFIYDAPSPEQDGRGTGKGKRGPRDEYIMSGALPVPRRTSAPPSASPLQYLQRELEVIQEDDEDEDEAGYEEDEDEEDGDEEDGDDGFDGEHHHHPPTAVFSARPSPVDSQVHNDQHAKHSDSVPLQNSVPPRRRETTPPLDPPNEPRRSAFTQRFPDALSVFVFHAHALLGRKCTPQQPGNPRVTQRATDAFSRLDHMECAEWDALCAQLQSGDSRPLRDEVGEEFFERHGLLEELRVPPPEDTEPAVPIRKDSVMGAEAAAASSSSQAFQAPRPRQQAERPFSGGSASVTSGGRRKGKGKKMPPPNAPKRRSGPSRQWAAWRRAAPHRKAPASFLSRKMTSSRPSPKPTDPILITYNDDSENAKRIAFIAQAPDSVIQRVDAVDFRHACSAAFGDRVDLDRCRKLCPSIWIAQFKDSDAAKEALADGVSIQYNGVPLFGDAFPRSTRILHCDLTGTDVRPVELIHALVAAYPPGECELFKSVDVGYFLVLPEPARFIFRLYVPVEKKGWPMRYVRFHAVDQTDLCRACGVLHFEVCPLATRVPLARNVGE